MSKSLARYSHVTFRLEDWTVLEQTDRDGANVKIEGYVDGKCPTDICKAVCCRTADLLSGAIGSGPCQFLNEETFGCKLHEKGVGCKPMACRVWPSREGDIDSTNEKAARLGFEERCQLRFVKG